MPKNKTAATVMLVVLLSGGVIFFGRARPVRQARDAVVSFFRPIMSVAGGAGRWLGRNSESEEVRRLKEENERLTAENFGRENLIRDIETLESALAFRKAQGIALTGGRVISYTRELGREILVIDRGASAGVKKGDVAVDGYGVLVGDVDDAMESSSRIVVASNAAVTFPVFFMPGGGSMLARGLGARAFSVELIPRTVLIREGDFIARRLPGRGGRESAIPVASIVGGDPDGASGQECCTEAGGGERDTADPPAAAEAGGFTSARAVLIARPEMLRHIFIIPSGFP